MRWASTLPDAPRVVPNALKNMLGGGEREARVAGHCELSVETRACSLASADVGARREKECTEEIEGRERRVERICEPYLQNGKHTKG